MRSECIIFVIKNEYDFLTMNLNNLNELKSIYDLYFVTRTQNDAINQFLKLNKFVNIELSYDPGYYEALKAGIDFVKTMDYKTWIEFGECGNISLSEIYRLDEINRDYNFDKSIIIASKYFSPHKKRGKRTKKYIKFITGVKISDPYSRFKIYNSSSFDAVKLKFNSKIQPYNLINFLMKDDNYIEVQTMAKRNMLSIKKMIGKFKLFFYLFFIVLYIKRYEKTGSTAS